MKANEQCFPVVLFIMLYKVLLTFQFLGEICECDHSDKTKQQYFPMIPFIQHKVDSQRIFTHPNP